MDKKVVGDAIDFVKQVFENDYSGHDYFHTLRVYELATNIASRENADIAVVQRNIISDISFEGTDSVVPQTLEGKCVQDADRFDAIGAIGIARAFAYGGKHNRIIYDPDIKPDLNMDREEYHKHISTTINHFYEKLFLLGDLMNTPTAKKIAEHREKYMREFILEFLAEWEEKV